MFFPVCGVPLAATRWLGRRGYRLPSVREDLREDFQILAFGSKNSMNTTTRLEAQGTRVDENVYGH
jgi:hypothetical protein